MSKAMLGYLAIMVLAVASLAIVMKSSAAPAAEVKKSLQLNLEHRKQALADL